MFRGLALGSGYGWRLMIKKLWVWILARDTRRIIFYFYLTWNFFCLKMIKSGRKWHIRQNIVETESVFNPVNKETFWVSLLKNWAYYFHFYRNEKKLHFSKIRTRIIAVGVAYLTDIHVLIGWYSIIQLK